MRNRTAPTSGRLLVRPRARSEGRRSRVALLLARARGQCLTGGRAHLGEEWPYEKWAFFVGRQARRLCCGSQNISRPPWKARRGLGLELGWPPKETWRPCEKLGKFNPFQLTQQQQQQQLLMTCARANCTQMACKLEHLSLHVALEELGAKLRPPSLLLMQAQSWSHS